MRQELFYEEDYTKIGELELPQEVIDLLFDIMNNTNVAFNSVMDLAHSSNVDEEIEPIKQLIASLREVANSLEILVKSVED